MPANTVVVARGPGRKWGNPFKVGKPAADLHGLAPGSAPLHDLTQEEAVVLFRRWLAETEQGRALEKAAKTELRGKNLACWCRADQVCHADVWLEVANEKKGKAPWSMKKSRLIYGQDLENVRERDRGMVAFHEAGHFVVAHHFGVADYCYIKHRGTPTDERLSFTGQTKWLSATPFRNAVVGWAGVLGESAHDRDPDIWKDECEAIWDLHNPEDPAVEMSATDLAAVNSHPWKLRAFNTAVQIIEKRFALLQKVAAHLIENEVCDMRQMPNGGIPPAEEFINEVQRLFPKEALNAYLRKAAFTFSNGGLTIHLPRKILDRLGRNDKGGVLFNKLMANTSHFVRVFAPLEVD